LSQRPEIIAIDHDGYHAKHVGVLPDGRQFFLTTPFEGTSKRHPGGEYVALFIFDRAGRLVDAVIDNFGPRASMDGVARQALYELRLKELGDVTLGRILVAPFEIERFGTVFGLVARVPEESDDVWAVEMLPGNYMAFFEPWDSGDYDT
jgi:hypothetical protein